MQPSEVCDHCGKTAAQACALVAMMPGRDGKEWYLCGRCWADGRTPMKLGKIEVSETVEVVDDPKASKPRRKRSP